MNSMDGAYSLSGYDRVLLKKLMSELVDEARWASPFPQGGVPEGSGYSPDHALMDLLAILDNRAERERRGGESSGVLSYHMWGICRRATGFVNEVYWIEKNLSEKAPSKAEIRNISYRALSHFIEKGPRLN